MPDELDAQRARPAADAPLVCGCTDAPPDMGAPGMEPRESAEQPEPAPAPPAAQEAQASSSSAAGELKLIVSIRDGRSTIGVQRPASDPHLESDGALDLSTLLERIPGVLERAQARWREAPKHPAYARPAPRPRRGGRRGQASSQGSVDEPETAAAQQQTLQLF